MLPPFNPWLTSLVAADVVAASSAGDDALAARQRRRFGALLAAAAETSPLYRELLAGRDPATYRPRNGAPILLGSATNRRRSSRRMAGSAIHS